MISIFDSQKFYFINTNIILFSCQYINAYVYQMSVKTQVKARDYLAFIFNVSKQGTITSANLKFF